MSSLVSQGVRAAKTGVLPPQLDLFKAMIEAATDLTVDQAIFKLNGVGLEDACKRHAQNLMTYGICLQECKTLEESVRVGTEELESSLYRNLNENNNRTLGQRDLVIYLKSEPTYVAAQELLLEIAMVKRKLEAIVEALQSMGWSLGHIVKLRVAQLEDVTL